MDLSLEGLKEDKNTLTVEKLVHEIKDSRKVIKILTIRVQCLDKVLSIGKPHGDTNRLSYMDESTTTSTSKITFEKLSNSASIITNCA